jgi:VWFA-related protein
MTKRLLATLLLLPALAHAQQTPTPAPPQPDGSQQQPYTLQTGRRIVLVPATVSLKGQIIYGLKVDQFQITDNGVPQTITLDEEAQDLGLSLVVVLQCSRMAAMEYEKIRGLPDLIDAMVGGAPHEIALVRYGSHPELIQPFTKSPEKLADAMARMGPCEDGDAATRDAVSYASSILENRDSRNRHAVLLIGEARDHGSSVKEKDLIAQLGRSNTVVDAVAYQPGKNETMDDLKHFQGGRGPIGTIIQAVQGMKKNTAKAVATLSGGDYIDFSDRKGFDRGIDSLTNRVHNYYLLSFPVARDAENGLHEIRVTVPQYPKADIRARRNYYAGDTPPPDSVQ